MESRATARYVRVTARKVNQILDLVRGSDVESALNTLTFSKKHVAKRIEKTVRSAVANAVQADSKIDVEDLYIKEALVGPGPIMKRWLPRAQGRATPILKRSCHITIILADKDLKAKKRTVRAAKTAGGVEGTAASPGKKKAPARKAKAGAGAKSGTRAKAAASAGRLKKAKQGA